MKKSVHLVVIDPQNSFCSVVYPAQQQITHNGELCIPGAAEDMGRVAALIRRLGRCLTNIHITLESRHALHISHPSWFRDSQGTPPVPFTVMSEKCGRVMGRMIEENGREHQVGEFYCSSPGVQRRTIEYLGALQSLGRYSHVIWPPHCLIGTLGHNVVPEAMQALLDWTIQNDCLVNFIRKGSNPFVERFSVVRAEIDDPYDSFATLESPLIEQLQQADEVIFAGAGRNSLANTVQDIVNSLESDDFTNRSVLLLDGMSPFLGSKHTLFVDEMKRRGMKSTTTLDYLA